MTNGESEYSILTAEIREEVEEKIHDIARNLISTSGVIEDKPGLMDGNAGLALFFFYTGRYLRRPEYHDYGLELLSGVFSQLNSDQYSDHSFAGGFSGIGWLLDHLEKNRFADTGANNFWESLGGFFQTFLLKDLESHKMEYFYGALGTGFGMLNILSNTFPPNNGDCLVSDSDTSLNQRFRELLITILDKIARTVNEPHDPETVWPSLLFPGKRKNETVLGLAHGVTALADFLTRLVRAGIKPGRAKELLRTVTGFLMECTIDQNQYGSFFSYSSGNGIPAKQSRMAWCQGDPGIGVILLNAAQVTGNRLLEKKSLDILSHSAQRRELQENFVLDACFCHGTAGLARIFHRVFTGTGMEIFKETAVYWYGKTLELASHFDGCGGFKSYCGENNYRNILTLSGGASGIGLSLLSALFPESSDWDNCFLLS